MSIIGRVRTIQIGFVLAAFLALAGWFAIDIGIAEARPPKDRFQEANAEFYKLPEDLETPYYLAFRDDGKVVQFHEPVTN